MLSTRFPRPTSLGVFRQPTHSTQQRPVGSTRFGQDAAKSASLILTHGFYSQRLNHAYAFATKHHQHQNSSGSTTPYVAHLMEVASTFLRFASPLVDAKTGLLEPPSKEFPQGVTLEDGCIAALFHDLVEDQGGAEMLEKIRAKFGDTVATLVDYCTDYKPRDITYNARKLAYLKRVANGPPTVLLISASDKLANLRLTVAEYLREGEVYWKKFNHPKNEKMNYFKDIIHVFKATGRFPELMQALEFTVLQLQILRWFGPLLRVLYPVYTRLQLFLYRPRIS